MNVLGINAFHGDASAALVKDGVLVAAIEEERLNRKSEESVTLGLKARSIKARLPPLVDIIVAVGTCLVPSLIGVHFNNAEGIYQGAPYNFTGVVIRGTGAPNGNFIITAQDRTGGTMIPCNTDITVNRP